MTVTSTNEAFETAIDAVAMGSVVRAALGDADHASTSTLYVTRVFPINENELCIQYAAEYAGPNGTVTRALRGACLPFDGVVPARYRDRDGLVVTAPAIGLAIPVFPFDPVLPQLESLCQPRAAWDYLRQWLGRNGAEPTEVSRTVQAYRLERRCVLRFDVRDENEAETHIFVKVARPRKLRRAANAFAALRERGFGCDGPFIVPDFTHVAGDGYAFMNEVAGTSVHDLIGTDAFLPALESTARILANLHESAALDDADTQTPAGEIEKLRTWGRLLQRMYPKLHVEFEMRLDQLASQQPIPAVTLTPVHGDFHDKQVMYTAEQTALIDCDGLNNGDPCQDYGNFVAHMQLRRLQHTEHVADIAAGLNRFREAYPREGAVEWWTAMTFLRLAAIYSLRPRWRHLSMQLLDLADINAARGVVEG